MAKTPAKIKLSIPSYHEIAGNLEAAGIKLTENETLIIDKDVSLERPIDWRLLTVRKDCIIEAAKVYRHPVDPNGDFEITDCQHFLNFVEELYQYILNGKKPDTEAKNAEVKEIVAVSNKGGW